MTTITKEPKRISRHPIHITKENSHLFLLEKNKRESVSVFPTEYSIKNFIHKRMAEYSKQKSIKRKIEMELFSIPDHDPLFSSIKIDHIPAQSEVICGPACGVTELPDLPPGLLILSMRCNELEHLPDLPDSVYFVDITGNPISEDYESFLEMRYPFFTTVCPIIITDARIKRLYETLRK